MPRNSRIQIVGKLEVREIEALADITRELEHELRQAWWEPNQAGSELVITDQPEPVADQAAA